jgi:hypothetical protein
MKKIGKHLRDEMAALLKTARIFLLLGVASFIIITSRSLIFSAQSRIGL